MKKWMIAAAAAGVLMMQPFQPQDAGRLYVVETLALEERSGEILVASGDVWGRGSTVTAALENMEERTPGLLFLRQVKRVILCGDTDAAVLSRLPEEIPMGAVIYTSQAQAQELAPQAELQEILEAREVRDPELPKLAEILDQSRKRDLEGR